VRGRLVIISSPSGAGKTTLARRLLEEFDNVEFSVSYTTRKARVNERPGVDYHFVDDAAFDRMIAAGEFAEWAEVHDNRYGTARASVELALQGGRDVVFDVDWQGGGVLSDKWPRDSVKIFILPPDLATLEARLRRRATDAEEVIQRRLRKAIEELGHFGEYRYLIVNDDLDAAYDILRAVYLVNRYADLAASADSAADSAVVEHARALIAKPR
jgi:guanylate kinase